jgi:diguanylate cyclase (GGDEF)-like protein
MPPLAPFRQLRRQQVGYTRQFAIGVLAAVLMAGGVFLAARSMDVDREIHHRYEQALALSQLALETQQLSAELRSWQTRLARSSPAAGASAAALDPLKSTIDQLQAKLGQIGAFRLSSGERGELQQLQRALDDLERVTVPRDSANLDFAAFEQALERLVGAVRARTLDAVRRAEAFGEVARVGVIAFSAITVVLGLLLAVLTLRTLRANRLLMNRLEHLAREDALTGAANRRGLDDALPVEFARALRSGSQLTLVMIDLDHFKRFNDRRGHGAGDAVLHGAAQAWLKQMRPTDLLARYGGEEFTLVLPGCDSDQAIQLIDRMRPLVPERQTFSAGIATWDRIETAAELLQRADSALLQAKKAGRNRTMIAGREPQVTLPLRVA